MADDRRGRVPALQILPLAVLLVGAFFVPLSILFAYSFWQQDGFNVVHNFTLDNYRSALTDTFYLRLLVRSLLIGTIVASCSIALAYPYAYIATFRFPRARNQLLFAALLSLFSSYLVRVYAFQTILGEKGTVNWLLETLGIIHAPLSFLLFNSFAVVITLVNVFFPFALLPIWGAMQNVERNHLEAARDLGSRPLATFFHVVVPATRTGARASFLFVFVLASGDYVTPSLVGGTNGLMIGRSISDAFGLTNDNPLGSALAFSLLAAFGVVLWIIPSLLSRLPRPAAVGRSAGAGLRALSRVRLPGSPAWAHLYLSVALLYLFAPLAIIIILSFTRGGVPAFPMHGVTLHWYRVVFGDEAFVAALITSVKVAAMTAAGGAVIGTLAALALAHDRLPLRKLVTALVVAPLAMPGLITGVAMLTFAIAIGLALSTTTIALGHLVYATPFVVLAIVARLRDLDPNLAEAGRDLGRGPFGVFRKVTLPLAAPAIAGAALVAAALSLDEFVITNFVSGRSVTLPLFIWAKLRTGVTPDTNAVCTVILAGLIVLFLISHCLTRITGGRQLERDPS
jgi:ABC-type spermidine/putrescine transport system permease subunit I